MRKPVMPLFSLHREYNPSVSLNPNFQASSHLLWLYGLVCVRPSRLKTPKKDFPMTRSKCQLPQHCSNNTSSLTFYFSFEDLLELNPIQANRLSQKESLRIENNQGGGMKIRTITSRFWKKKKSVQISPPLMVILQVS